MILLSYERTTIENVPVFPLFSFKHFATILLPELSRRKANVVSKQPTQ
jgi:hypothetical protein